MIYSRQTFSIAGIAGIAMLALLMLMATGCVVRSEQLDLTRQLTQGGSIDADRFAWRMTFNDTEATVYAVSVGGGIVFASREGPARARTCGARRACKSVSVPLGDPIKDDG